LGLYAETRQHVDQPESPWLLAADFVAGLAFVVAGLAVRRMRPGNRCWWLLIGAGATWFVGSLQSAADPDVALVGFAFGIWHYVALSWLLLAYPTGRLAGRRERAVLALAAGLAAIRTLSRLFLYVPPDGTGCGCVTNRFAPVTDPRWYSAVDSAFPWVLVAVLVLVLGCALARWRRSSRAGRRMVTPVLLAGAALVTQVAYDYVIRQRTGLAAPSRTALFMLVVALRVATAAAFVAGLREQRAARSAVVDLVGSLDDRDTAPDRLGAALRSALGDPSLELVAWSPAERAYVGTTGQHLVLPVAEPGRAVTLVEQDGAPVAALVHDEALLEDPGLVSAVAAAVRLTSDNERLRRELQRQLAEVAASRSRIVAAGDAERRRIERDLHDGAQQRLVTIALALRLADARLDADADPVAHDALSHAVKDLSEAIVELRDLARGIHPAVLTESGLETALGSLVDRSCLPAHLDVQLREEPPASVSAAAYFAVSEALTNVAKHSHATDVVVQVRTDDGVLRILVTDDGVGGADPRAGSGLRGLTDRVEAAGGTLCLASPPAGGTRLEVELPCA
jgi:signal transduction histidine kinase